MANVSSSDFVESVAEATGLSKTDARRFLAIVGEVSAAYLKAVNPDDSIPVIPGFLKVTKKHKKATKARPGRNPFTGESIMIAAKKARNSVKASALKKLKEAV